MAIELAPDNHLALCRKLSAQALKSRSNVWMTISEWADAVDTGFYSDDDCDGEWACEWGKDKYVSSIAVSTDDLTSAGRPVWATHVMWTSK